MPSKSIEELERTVGDSNVTAEVFAVEAGKVEEFARAVGDGNPVHYDATVAAERGHEAVPAPLTFTQVAQFPRYRPKGVGRYFGFNLGLDPRRVVHGEQAYEFERPAYVGDTLTGTTTLEDVYRRETDEGALTFVVFATEFRDGDDELVATERVTAIERPEDGSEDDGNGTGDGYPGAGSNRTATDPREATDGTGGPDTLDGSSAVPVLADRPVEVGTTGPDVRVENLGLGDFVRYAGASGDFNPIHYDESYARDSGYPTVFGQGMLTAGIAVRLLCSWVGVGNVERFRVRFESPLWPGDSVRVGGTVTDVFKTDDGRAAADIDVEAESGAGTLLLAGDATTLLPTGEDGGT